MTVVVSDDPSANSWPIGDSVDEKSQRGDVTFRWRSRGEEMPVDQRRSTQMRPVNVAQQLRQRVGQRRVVRARQRHFR